VGVFIAGMLGVPFVEDVGCSAATNATVKGIDDLAAIVALTGQKRAKPLSVVEEQKARMSLTTRRGRPLQNRRAILRSTVPWPFVCSVLAVLGRE
jgi:hypothetical protein